jgi:hypothetical protein
MLLFVLLGVREPAAAVACGLGIHVGYGALRFVAEFTRARQLLGLLALNMAGAVAVRADDRGSAAGWLIAHGARVE